MKVLFAADHAGFSLKEILVPYVKALGYDVEDCGATSFQEDDDYPDYISKAAEKVSANPKELCAVVLGGSGQGEAIVANRYPHVRAVVFNGQYEPKDGRKVPDELALTREHNNANVLSLGARFLNADEAQAAVKKWLEIPFAGEERHIRRIRKIEELFDE